MRQLTIKGKVFDEITVAAAGGAPLEYTKKELCKYLGLAGIAAAEGADGSCCVTKEALSDWQPLTRTFPRGKVSPERATDGGDSTVVGTLFADCEKNGNRRNKLVLP